MLNRIKILLGIKDSDQLLIAQTVLEGVVDKVRTYCNIDYIPRGLEPVIIDMVVARYRSEHYGTEDIPMAVSSVSDNGQSIGYKVTGSSASATATEFSDGEITLLNAYRKVRW